MSAAYRLAAVALLLLLTPVVRAEAWQPLWGQDDPQDDQGVWSPDYDLRSAQILTNGTHLRIQLETGLATDDSRNSYRLVFRTPSASHVIYCDVGSSTPLDEGWDYCSGWEYPEGSTEGHPGIRAVVEQGEPRNQTVILFSLAENGLGRQRTWSVAELRSEVVLATSQPWKQQLQVTVADSLDELGDPFMVGVPPGSQSQPIALTNPDGQQAPAPAFAVLAALLGSIVCLRRR